MKLPFKPHVIALVCCTGLLAASGVLYVKSRSPEAPVPAPVPVQTAPAPVATPPQAPTAAAAPDAKPTFTTAQIDQWVAPIALFPDPLLSQVLMASTYPANVVQAVQWSRDNPNLQGDAAIQAVAGQPWDPSVKSLVAFPQLMAMMGENPPWVQNLGDAFLGQPQDVMDSVQRLRLLAQQTGALKSSPQQTVTSEPKKTVAATQTTTTTTTNNTTNTTTQAPAPTVIKIEPTDPQVVYVPSYNPSTVYGTWPNTAYPPVYMPPPPGQQFASSFVNGFGFSLGVATTYALFSDIDWDDDDDDYHHDHDDYNGGGGHYERNGDNNINIDVENLNRISGQNLKDRNMNWQHNPAYRGGVPYQSNAVSQRFNQTNANGGLRTTQQSAATTASRDSQRQAAMTQLQQRNNTSTKTAQQSVSSRDMQRKAASQQLNQVAQRNNYRGYDTPQNSTRREAAQKTLQKSTTPKQQQNRNEQRAKAQQQVSQQQRDNARQRVESSTTQRRSTVSSDQRQARVQSNRPNAFSGNDSRSPSWQSQQSRGQESRRVSRANTQQRAEARGNVSERHERRR